MTVHRARLLCIGALAAWGAYTLAMLPVAPSLLGEHPVLLEGLRGSTPAMVTAGAFARVGRASLPLVLLLPLPTLMLADPLVWWAGRLWGPSVTHTLAGSGPRARRRAERAARWAERYGAPAVVLAYFLPVPSAIIYAGAGWSGMSLRRFIALDLVGTLLWVGTNVGLGYGIGQSAVDVAKAISRYGLILTIALVVVVFVVAARRARVAPEG